MNVRTLLLVALGSAAGGMLRYAVGQIMPLRAPGSFPWPTCAVNLAGSLVIGLLAGFATRQPFWMAGTGWPLLAIGLCGGFTTFSTFSLDALQLVREGAHLTALAYVLGSAVSGILLCYLGYAIAAIQG